MFFMMVAGAATYSSRLIEVKSRHEAISKGNFEDLYSQANGKIALHSSQPTL
jgi:hypothetical protein